MTVAVGDYFDPPQECIGMAQHITTPGTDKMTSAQSRIRAEISNYPSSSTKFTVIHKRAISSIIQPPASTSATSASSASTTTSTTVTNVYCRFAQHFAQVKAAPEKTDVKSKTVASAEASAPAQVKGHRRRLLKRSLSADHLEAFQPPPARRPFPVRIWFNHKPGRRLPVATAHWQDSPLYDTTAFVFTKLLEASQAHRYLQLQGRPRKYLHLTGGGIQSINKPTPAVPTAAAVRKAESALPPMTIRVRTVGKEVEKAAVSAVTMLTPVRKAVQALPPPPPLISLHRDFRQLRRLASVPQQQQQQHRALNQQHQQQQQQQEEPLELCKRRRPHEIEPSTAVTVRRSKSPSNQPINLVLSNGAGKRKAAPPISLTLAKQASLQEPLNLATPSPTSAFRRMSLSGPSSPTSPGLAPSNPVDGFRRRLASVLQVLLGPRQLHSLGHPQVGTCMLCQP